MKPAPMPTPSRSSESGDLELHVPRRLKGSALASLVAFALAAATSHFTLAAKVDAAAAAASRAPKAVLDLVGPRIKSLEGARDVAAAERQGVADEVRAVRLYLCRDCERARRGPCDDICRSAP